jgi:hypothetical protein
MVKPVKPPKPKQQAKTPPKRRKKPANPNLRPGTKQTEKNRRKQVEKKLQELRKDKQFLKIGGPRPKLGKNK